MSLRYGLLGQLNYADATGYNLKKAFDQSLNFFWNAHKSQIYKELTTLKREGLLSVKLVVQEDKPNQKVYSITPEGREELCRWLDTDLIIQDFVVRETFLIKVFFWGEISPASAVEKLQQFIKIHKQKLESFKPIEQSIESYSGLGKPESALFWGLTAKYGYMNNKTAIQWAEEAIMQIQGVPNERRSSH